MSTYPDSSVNIVNRLRAGEGRNHGSRHVTCGVSCSGHCQHQLQGVQSYLSNQILKALHDGVNWLGLEAEQSLPSSAEVKNAWRYISTLSVSML